MNDFLKGQIEVYCYMVQRGKPAAMLPVQKRYIQEAAEFVKSYGLEVHKEDLSQGWCEFWIFKYSHIQEVIGALQQITDETLKHWVLGKLFGYSEVAIYEFTANQL